VVEVVYITLIVELCALQYTLSTYKTHGDWSRGWVLYASVTNNSTFLFYFWYSQGTSRLAGALDRWSEMRINPFPDWALEDHGVWQIAED
jgi:hypothetical protein